MTELFPACVQVLQSKLYPMHYRELTHQAIQLIKNHSLTEHEMFRAAEDVREKLLQAKRLGTFYAPDAGYLGAMQSWFPSRQMVMNFDFVTIPSNLRASFDGGFEAIMRLPHMKTKVINSPARYMACVKGQILEKHVAYWFQSQYPNIYSPPANSDDWRSGCDHDFLLNLPTVGKLKIDVMGANKNGKYKMPQGKPHTSVHLLCRSTNNAVLWEGCVRGSQVKNEVIPAKTFSPICFLVWLNCQLHGIDYQSILFHL
jgi:hypothetical protein